MKEEEREQRLREREVARLRRKKNRPLTFVSAFFILIFVSLIGYLIYFDAIKSEDFINSPYNTRQDTFSDRVVRGSIQSSDGEILAQTNVYEDGTEERTYPFSNIFAHAVGYDTNGKSGLESEANFQLLTSHSFFLEQIPEICGILCIGLGCLGAVKGILMNSDINFWGGQLIVGVMFGIVVFLFDRLTNMEHTKRKIKINLLYYLENILPNRMEKNLKKQNYEKNEKIKKSQKIKQEKEDARQLKEHWGEIASAKELQLTDEDIQTLKDFMKDL